MFFDDNSEIVVSKNNDCHFEVQRVSSIAASSVARGGYSPPIGVSTKMQNKKNITFLALLRLFYALEWIQVVI